MQWPDVVVAAYREFFSKEPHPWERSDELLAILTAKTLNTNRDKSSTPTQLNDLRPHRHAWDEPEAPLGPDGDAPLSIFS